MHDAGDTAEATRLLRQAASAAAGCGWDAERSRLDDHLARLRQAARL